MVVQSAGVEAPPLPQIQPLPQHVAVIMDGNGRWAEARDLRRQEGHRAGAEAIRDVIGRFGAHGVRVLSLFAFSTENWGRPRGEVEALMRLASQVIEHEIDALDRSGVRLRHIGDLEGLPGALRKRVRGAVERTAGNAGLTVNLAFNYGGRADIVQAVRQLMAEGLRPEDVSEEAIQARLTS